MNKAQEIQNKIYRKMSAQKKLEVVNDFRVFSIKLQNAKKNDNPKVSQQNLKCSKRS